MTDKRPSPAELLHLRGQTLGKGAPIAPPMTMASMFHLPGDPSADMVYGRMGNPSWSDTEKMLSHLEGAPALLFPSGMAAVTAAFMATLSSGMTALLPADGYYNSRLLLNDVLSRFGVKVEERPTVDFAAGGFDGFDVVFVETPSNPGLDMCDIEAIASEVRTAGGITIVDNTTMTPFGQRPMELGADIVVASDTKAPGGHSDLLLGHVAAKREDLVAAMANWRKLSGSIPGPFEAWMLHRSLETLEVRFDRMCTSAGIIAQRLAEHPQVRRARYPGLPGDPGHNLARKQMLRDGFLIGVDLGDEARGEAFIDGCPFLRPATSFGGVHSSAERRARWGDAVGAGFVRLSVGCEPVDELWAALAASLDALA